MQNLLYYLICTVIWGSTYFVITFQIQSASAYAAVFFRFLISTGLLWVYCFIRQKTQKLSRIQHFRLIFQGLFLFCLNYVLIYKAESFLPSGLMALIFMSMVYFNIIGMYYFFNKPITRNVFVGAICGALGLILVFKNQLAHASESPHLVKGLLLGVGAALSASIGNLISFRNSFEKLPILVTNAWGMLYGTGWCLLIGFLLREDFTVHWSLGFASALIYLSVFGTLIAFGTYLTLVGRIGAEKAVYSTVVSPVIALVLSGLFENFQWTGAVIAGVGLCFMGNIVTLSGSLGSKR